MKYHMHTRHYYAKWADVEPDIFDTGGLCIVESVEREVAQKGYSRPFDLYCVITDNATVISHSKKMLNNIDEICDLFIQVSSIKEIIPILSNVLNESVGHSIKFEFTEPRFLDNSGAVKLLPENYNEYLEFFTTVYPEVKTDWVEEYYLSMVKNEYCWGFFNGTRLVSCTDAPDIPFMSDLIVEPGINTLHEFRQRGYAKKVVGAMINSVVARGKVPIWSCTAGNVGSANLARSIGYKKFADVFTVSLSG